MKKTYKMMQILLMAAIMLCTGNVFAQKTEYEVIWNNTFEDAGTFNEGWSVNTKDRYETVQDIGYNAESKALKFNCLSNNNGTTWTYTPPATLTKAMQNHAEEYQLDFYYYYQAGNNNTSTLLFNFTSGSVTLKAPSYANAEIIVNDVTTSSSIPNKTWCHIYFNSVEGNTSLKITDISGTNTYLEKTIIAESAEILSKITLTTGRYWSYFFFDDMILSAPKGQEDISAPTWDFGALYEKHGNKAKVTYTDETIKLGGADCNICTGDYEGLAMQGADNWITYETGGLYQGNGGGRNLGILNLKKDQIVTIIADAECLTLKNDESTAIQSSVKNTDGKYVYTYIMVADAALVVNMARKYTLFSINIETPDPNANIPVTGITLNKSTAEVTVGMTVNLLSATISPVNATDKSIVWSSSNEAVATVDNGVVTGKTIGTATITAKAGEVTASCEITVKEKANKSFWDFASLYEKLGNKKAMTYAINTIKVGNIDCEYGIGEYEGLAMQAAGGWMLYSSGGLYQGNGGGRNIGVLDLEAGQIVTIIANNSTCLTLVDATTASQISIETTDDKSTYTYVMNTDGILALNMTRYYTLFSINVEDARELTLTEGADLTASGVYSSATYTREIVADTYGTICLPFAPDAETLESYSFFRLESEEEGALNFVEEATPAANTPYLYCLKEGKEATAITGGVTTVSSTMNDIVAGDWTMKGSFTNQTIATAEADTKYYGYAPANNQVVKANKTLTILPYRAYFTAPKDAANVRVRITRGDETTAIDNAQLTIDNSQLIYDLQGRRVESMTKGIYIVNGKKVIF